MSKFPDILSIKFKKEKVFTTLEDFISIKQNAIITKEIPAQYKDEKQAKAFETSTNLTKNTGIGVVVGLIAGQLAGKEVIKRIWSLFMTI